MNDWLASLAARLRTGRPVVRVAIAAVRGSAPREPGASMLVSGEAGQERLEGAVAKGLAAIQRRAVEGTIGGGHPEWKAITVAQQMLAQQTRSWMDRYTLGASLGQCCGGAVELWFERYDAADLPFIEEALARRVLGPATFTTLIDARTGTDVGMGRAAERRSLQYALPQATPRFALSREGQRTRIVERIDAEGVPLYLFGAGHVGTALVQVLGGLPLRITWIDSREEQFGARLDVLPENVSPLLSDEPEDEVDFAPAGACYLVLTHSHDLDHAICSAILRRGDFAWAGLIGSATKAASFAGRWERQGHAREDIARITCPIGLPGIASKHPGAIAIAVAAQLQQVIEAHALASREASLRPARTGARAAQRQEQEATLAHAAMQEAAARSDAHRH